MSMPPSNVRAGGAQRSLARALDPTRPTIRLLRIALALIAALVSLRLTAESFAIPMWGVDVVIPLRAAGRWLAGGEPYLASGFLTGPGYDNPYLYPPIFLAPYGLLGALPLVPVLVAASVACALAAYVALRRLGLPPWAVLAVFLWPPVSGAIQGGNVALLMFAAFTGIYWYRSRVRWQPHPRVPGEDARPALVDGLLGGVIPALKISQAHAWVGLLRFRPKAALLGLAVFGGLAIVLLPVLPLSLWFDWFEQSGRAADPGWAIAGSSLTSRRSTGRHRGRRPRHDARLPVRSPAPRRPVDRPPHRDRRADAAHARRALRDPRDARGPPRDRAAGGHPGGNLHVRRDVARPGARHDHEPPRATGSRSFSSRRARR